MIFVAKKCVIAKLEAKKYFYFYYLHTLLSCIYSVIFFGYVLGNLCPRFGIVQVQHSREGTVFPMQSKFNVLIRKTTAELIFFLTA